MGEAQDQAQRLQGQVPSLQGQVPRIHGGGRWPMADARSHQSEGHFGNINTDVTISSKELARVSQTFDQHPVVIMQLITEQRLSSM